MIPFIPLVPIFIIAGIFWIFGPAWSWLPFIIIFLLFFVITILARPSKISDYAPTAAQSSSSTFTATMILSIPIAIGILIRGRYWEIVFCLFIFISSAILWPKMSSLV